MSDKEWDPYYAVAVDYDYTLTKGVWGGDLIESRVKDICALQKMGAVIVLWTSRFGDDLDEAIAKLKLHGLVPDFINEYP